ncbi:MAG: hypothetical protein GX793_09285 [Bacteroidales bacterium]|jgi:hypothetical protein|nr:hypothetical protein [Bacteroidales bacterium]MCK9499864.1 hypothetical protein [Bacteroidales bacterium]MDY0315223.1 hypothetical protein [Bacteroidales bacterium]NLB87239.1 hypothetical protein [Bacteroidales bacterium]
MRRIFFLNVIILLLFSCNNFVEKPIENKNNYSENEDISLLKLKNEDSLDLKTIRNDYFEEPVIQSYRKESDTLVISEDCVIFLWPDSLEIENLKITKPNSYLQILEEMISSASEVALSLDAVNIKNYFSDKEVLLIKNIDSQEIIHRKKVNFNMVVFKYGEKAIFCNTFDYDKDSCANIFNNSEILIDLDSIDNEEANESNKQN